jgi:hypothetical protein
LPARLIGIVIMIVIVVVTSTLESLHVMLY